MTIAFRSIKNHKFFFFINVFGLATGISFCLLIFLFVKDEQSFDRFHTKADRIFRVHQINLHEQAKKERKGLTSKLSGQFSSKMIYLPLPLGPALKRDLPEVESFVRFKGETTVIRKGKEAFKETIHLTDANFFDVFSFDLLQGKKENVLKDLSSVVLTKDMATKMFGNQNPIGQTLYITLQGTEKGFIVSGITQPVPGNSSLSFNVLIRIEHSHLYNQFKQVMQSYFSVFTFIVLHKQASQASFTTKLQSFVDRRFAAFSDMFRQQQQLPQSTRVLQAGITPLTDTHFDTSVPWPKVNNPLYSYILSAIALLILAVACVNYITLFLTRSASRVQEIGVRKVMGASRRHIALQLWIESQVMVWLAAGLAIGLIYLLLPGFNALNEKSLTLNVWQQPAIIGAILLLALLVSIVAGGYPALLLSNFQPANVLKSARTYRINPWFSKLLLVLQYSICLFLVSSTIIMYRQMQHISEKDLGFNKEQVVILENYSEWGQETAQLLSRFRQWSVTNPHIISVSGTNAAFPGAGISQGIKLTKGQVLVDAFIVDDQYLATLGIPLVDGRNFSIQTKTGTEGVIVNETLASMLGRDSTDGGVANPLMGSKVIGIVKDHHYASLESKISPMILTFGTDAARNILIKVQPGHIAETLSAIKQAWQNLAPKQPFVYTFLDEDLATQYKTYQNWMQLVKWASLFAVFIACMGLFAMSGLSAINRTKEMGIRKVMGASVSQLFLLLNKEVIQIAAISFVVAAPFAWYLMRLWLEDFAYRVTISWDMFAVAAFIGLFTAALAVSFHSLKAAKVNPVNSLRNE